MCDSFWTSLEFLFVFIFILLMSRYPCSLCAFVFFPYMKRISLLCSYERTADDNMNMIPVMYGILNGTSEQYESQSNQIESNQFLD